MKRLRYFLPLVLVALAVPSIVTAQWNIEIVDGASGENVGIGSSIALDSSDHPHISYHAFPNNNLKYASFDGAAWNIESVDSGYYDISLALDPGDNPHISYDNFRDLKYAYYDGTAWKIQTVDSGIFGAVGSLNSLALDSGGRPHISYYDNTNDDLKYAYYDGAAWNIQTVDSGGDVGRDSSIAIDSDDNPHISYIDLDNFDLKYAYYDSPPGSTGGTWNIDVVEHVFGGKCSSLALDSGGNPHISYAYSGPGYLKYAYYDGAAWNIEFVDRGIGGTYVQNTSLALDSSDSPHISYSDISNSDIKYAYYDGAAWQITIVDSGDVGYYVSLALDSSDNPHISYHDNTNDDLKHAFLESPRRALHPLILLLLETE
jgi:hypothetical protein